MGIKLPGESLPDSYLHLSLNLKENSGHVRSESVLRKKIRIYQDAFAGNDSPYATKQMRGVSNETFIYSISNIFTRCYKPS